MYTTKTTLLLNVSNGDDVSWQDFYDNYRPLIISLASESGIPADSPCGEPAVFARRTEKKH